MENKGHIILQKKGPEKLPDQGFGRTMASESQTWQNQIKDNRESENVKPAFSWHSFPFIQSEDEKGKSMYKQFILPIRKITLFSLALKEVARNQSHLC